MTRAARRPQVVRGEILPPDEARRYLASGGVDAGTADAMPAPDRRTSIMFDGRAVPLTDMEGLVAMDGPNPLGPIGPRPDPLRTAREVANVAASRLESFGAERAPGLVALARQHPVATFVSGVASGLGLAWIFGGKS